MYDCNECNDKRKVVAPWEYLDPVEGYKLADRIPCPQCDVIGYMNAIENFNNKNKPETINGMTLEEWRVFARQDDCLDKMVPSDLRELISKITRF